MKRHDTLTTTWKWKFGNGKHTWGFTEHFLRTVELDEEDVEEEDEEIESEPSD